LILTAYHWIPQPRNQPGHAKAVVWDWRNNRVQTEISTPRFFPESSRAGDAAHGFHG
jgi:hypothetical protein